MGKGVLFASVKSAVVWALALGAVAAVGHWFFQRDSTETGLILLGLIFAAYCVATRTIAGRAKDATTLLLVGAGGAFGFWFPPLHDLFAEVVVTWAETGVIPAEYAAGIATPVAVSASGLMIAAVLYASTSSGSMFFTTVLVTSFVASAPMFKHLLGVYEPYAMPGALLLWHGAVAGSLGAWAVRQVRDRKASACPSCGFDLAANPATAVCPKCKKRLPNAGVLFTLSDGMDRSRAA